MSSLFRALGTHAAGLQHARRVRTDAGRDRSVLDAHWNLRLLIFRRSAVDRVGYLDSLNHPRESRKLSVEMRAVTNQYEEVRGRAVRLIAARHRNCAAHVF